MPEAARLFDPIQHSSALSGLLTGLAIGAAVALAGVAIVGTGGLAAVAIVGAGAVAGAGIGELIGSLSFATVITGTIIALGSLNVFINSIPAARALADFVVCSKHPPGPPIAQGSETVLINGFLAARVKDKTVCDASIAQGSPNVFIGGPTATVAQIDPEVPNWLHGALLIVGLGSAVVLAGPVVAFAGFLGAIVGGNVGSSIGGAIFGEGSDGQKLFAFGGAILGGGLAGRGAGWFNRRYEITTTGLGSNFGNVRIRQRQKPVLGSAEQKQTPTPSSPAIGNRPPPASENYRGRYNAARHAEGKSRLPADWDAHHRIPQEYRQHPEFKNFDFDAPTNIQGVKGSRSDTNIHQQITNQWADFRRTNPNPTRAQIEAFARDIDAKYKQHWWQ